MSKTKRDVFVWMRVVIDPKTNTGDPAERNIQLLEMLDDLTNLDPDKPDEYWPGCNTTFKVDFDDQTGLPDHSQLIPAILKWFGDYSAQYVLVRKPKFTPVVEQAPLVKDIYYYIGPEDRWCALGHPLYMNDVAPGKEWFKKADKVGALVEIAVRYPMPYPVP